MIIFFLLRELIFLIGHYYFILALIMPNVEQSYCDMILLYELSDIAYATSSIYY